MPSTQKPVRYAVVGAGQISQQAFMPAVAHTNNSTLTALVTGDEEKADKVGKQYGLTTYDYDGYDDMLASGEVDAVYIATPNFLHTDYTVKALKAGIHVLLEKPMAASVEDAEKMVAAQRESGAKLMVAYRLHHEPGNVEMWSRAQAGEFGELRSFTSSFTQYVGDANSRAKHGYWTGPVPDMGTYCINAVRNLFGAEPETVHAVGIHSPDRDFEYADTVAVTLRFPGERLAQFTVSYATAASETFTLVGTEASIRATPCYTYGFDTGITYWENRDGDETEHRFEPTAQFAAETQYFSDCILNDRTPEADGEEGLCDMRVLAAVERSLDSGEVVSLDSGTSGGTIQRAQALDIPAFEQPTMDEMVNVTPIAG